MGDSPLCQVNSPQRPTLRGWAFWQLSEVDPAAMAMMLFESFYTLSYRKGILYALAGAGAE